MAARVCRSAGRLGSRSRLTAPPPARHNQRATAAAARRRCTPIEQRRGRAPPRSGGNVDAGSGPAAGGHRAVRPAGRQRQAAVGRVPARPGRRSSATPCCSRCSARRGRCGAAPAGASARRGPASTLLRACCMMASAACFFLAFRRLPLAEGYLVFFTAPFMALALSALVLGERVPRRRLGLVRARLRRGRRWRCCRGSAAARRQGEALGYLAVLAGTFAFAVTQTVNRSLRSEAGRGAHPVLAEPPRPARLRPAGAPRLGGAAAARTRHARRQRRLRRRRGGGDRRRLPPRRRGAARPLGLRGAARLLSAGPRDLGPPAGPGDAGRRRRGGAGLRDERARRPPAPAANGATASALRVSRAGKRWAPSATERQRRGGAHRRKRQERRRGAETGRAACRPPRAPTAAPHRAPPPPPPPAPDPPRPPGASRRWRGAARRWRSAGSRPAGRRRCRGTRHAASASRQSAARTMV